MATFSTNLNKQLIVAKSVVSGFNSATPVGAVQAKKGLEDLFLQYQSVDGVSKSPLIPIGGIARAKATSYAAMRRKLAKYELALDSSVNSGAPIAGQEYITRITFFEWGSLSYEDQYLKYGIVKATSGMTADKFYRAMYASLKLNFEREDIPLLDFKLKGTTCGLTVVADPSYSFKLDVGASDTTAAISGSVVSLASEVVAEADLSATNIADLNAALAAAGIKAIVLSGTAPAADVTTAADIVGTGISIEEIEQPWVLGTKSSSPLKFKIETDHITASGLSVLWGVVTKVTSTTVVGNGKVTADMEYFYMGERGDIYRNVGFPYTLNTTYLVDATKEYCFIDIDYYYAGIGNEVQHSDKQLTLVIPAVGTTHADKITLANSVISAINTAYGSTLIASLS